MGGEFQVFYTNVRTGKVIKHETERFNGISVKVDHFETLERGVRESLNVLINDYVHNVKSNQ
jgi:hypothetical protein